MAMSSYEVVCRAIEFRRPERLPIKSADPSRSDVHGVGWDQIGVRDRRLRQTTDEWGCVWVRSDVPNMGQVEGHLLAH
jgi:hypothetical protein